MKSLTENFAVISMIEPKDNQAGSIDSESIDMSELAHVSLVYSTGAITGDDSVIKVYAGATTGTKTTELPFHYRKSGADYKATNNDQFGALTAIAAGAAGLTMDAAGFDHRVVVIEIDAREVPEGLNWLTVDYDDGSASVLLTSMLAIGVPRYAKHDVPTVVA
jgi:hypothetical protein